MTEERVTRGDVAARAASLALASAVCALPLRGFLTLADLPLPIRLSWFVLAAGAFVRPFQSLLFFLAGFALLPIVPERAGWPPVSLHEVWLFALLVPAWLRILAGRRPWRASLPAAYPIFLAIVTASLAVVLYPFHLAHGGIGPLLRSFYDFLRGDFIVAASQRHPYAPIVAWTVIVEGLALWWLIATEVVPDPARRAKQVLVALASGATLVAGYGLVQWQTGSNLLPFWLEMDPSIVRINATFTDVNGLGAYLAMMLWVVVGLGVSRECAAWRWTWWTAGAVILIATVFTASRAAWGAVLSGGILCALGLWRYGLLPAESWWARRMKRLLLGGLAAGLALAIGLTAYATTRNVRYWDQQSYVDGVLYTLNLRLPARERLKGRGALWAAAIRMVARHPIDGIGIGRYYKDVYGYAVRQADLPRPQENAHNYYLQVGAELGLAGLGALLALAGSGLVAGLRVARAPVPAPVRRIGLAVAVGLAAFAVTWLTGHSMLLRTGQFTCWTLAACAVVLGRQAGTSAAGRGGASARSRALVVAALVLIAASVPFRATWAARRVNLHDAAFGLYETEYDRTGRAQRWSGPRASIYVPASARAFRLPIRSLAPFPQRVEILLDGERADELQLADHDWHEVRYVLPPGRPVANYRRLDLRVDPPWQPPSDPRLLGVLIGSYRAE